MNNNNNIRTKRTRETMNIHSLVGKEREREKRERVREKRERSGSREKTKKKCKKKNTLIPFIATEKKSTDQTII